MSVNAYMHPRNIYRTPPNFKKLAIEYPEFRKYAKQDVTGKITIDFKDVQALRALSCTLLKKDFDLNVEIPANKLIPTIPLRLNYILWIEDLLSIAGSLDSVKGIDIGTGASCVYPLMIAKNYKWLILATEVDVDSVKCAQENVNRNCLKDLITVKKIEGDTLLKEAIDNSTQYDFCMCNPPFFSSSQEVNPFFKARKESRPRPRNAFCASPVEVVAKGGEVEFISKLVQESKELKKRVRIYSSMIGHKTSLSPIKQKLREAEVVSFKQTEFFQGHTTRWGLAWTFCDIDLRKVPVLTLTASRKQKTKPFIYVLSPDQTKNHSVNDIADNLKTMFAELKISFEEMKHSKNVIGLIISALSNTWSNQRRKRREQLRQEKLESGDYSKQEMSPEKQSVSPDTTNVSPDMQNTSNMLAGMSVNSPKQCCSTKRNLDDDSDEYYRCMKKFKSEIEDCNCNISNFYLKSTLVIRQDKSNISIELLWIEGNATKDVLHQILQYIKNNLKLN